MRSLFLANARDLFLWVRNRICEVTTYLGTGLAMLSEVAREYAPFDQRIAWVGLVCGAILVLLREQRNEK